MIVKYEAQWNKNIERVECTRETDKTVWLYDHRRKREDRRAKISDWTSYFDTWEEARCHHLKKAEKKAAGIRRQLELANSLIGNIKGMKKPDYEDGCDHE